MYKKIHISLCLMSMFACATPPERATIIPAVIVNKAVAEYPVDAYQNGIEGWVWVRYTVTEKGDVVNAEVIKSNSEVLFGPAAIAAIEKFKYRPRIVNGKASSITGVRYRFDFTK